MLPHVGDIDVMKA